MVDAAEIPMTDEMIKAVEAIAEQQGFTSLKIKNRHGVVMWDSAWIAGVDMDNKNNENKNKNNDNDEDDDNNEHYDPDDDDDNDDDDDDYDTDNDADNDNYDGCFFPSINELERL